MKILKHLPAAVLVILMLAFGFPRVLAASRMEVTGSADVVITSVSADASTGASARAEREDGQQALMEAGFSCPGAWTRFTLTVENHGSIAAVLSQVLQQDDTPREIHVSFGISDSDTGEILAPGERCTLTIVAQVDPNMTDAILQADGSFSLKLVYQADGTLPETGDRFPTMGLCLLAAGSLILFLLLRRRRTHES